MLTEKAYGKINLFLDLIGIRENGYHDIYTVMQSVSLHDIISLEVEPDVPFEVSLYCNGAELSCGDDNLIVRAAKRMQSLHPTIRGAHRFALQKNIPIAAGMAGGSADAAAVIRLMNRAHGLVLSVALMREIGATIGADVPFCVAGGTSLCEGIGERITDLPSPHQLHLAVAIGSASVSTPAAFRALDERVNLCYSGKPRTQITSESCADAKTCADLLYNLFEEVILPSDPYAKKIKDLMRDAGAMGTLMSGSGPSVFGIFPSAEQAERAVAALMDKGYRAFACHTVDKFA